MEAQYQYNIEDSQKESLVFTSSESIGTVYFYCSLRNWYTVPFGGAIGQLKTNCTGWGIWMIPVQKFICCVRAQQFVRNVGRNQCRHTGSFTRKHSIENLKTPYIYKCSSPYGKICGIRFLLCLFDRSLSSVLSLIRSCLAHGAKKIF